MPKLFDIHSHINFNAFKNDGDEVIKKTLEAGVWTILVGSQYDTSKRAVEYAEKYEKGIYAAVGLHPFHLIEQDIDISEERIKENKKESKQEIKEKGEKKSSSKSCHGKILMTDQSWRKPVKSRAEKFDPIRYMRLTTPKVVAIGECGLDYYRFQPRTDADSPAKISKGNLGGQAQTDADRIKDKQKKAFEAQIALAGEVKKPLMIHCRQAFDDLIDILVSCRLSLFSNPGIIHFFSGTKDDAKKLLDLDFSFSFGGVITFARDYDEVIKYIPMDRITLETDAPYVAPIPYRGKRNEPAYIVEVAKKIAEIKGLEFEEVSSITTTNAIKIFGLQN